MGSGVANMQVVERRESDEVCKLVQAEVSPLGIRLNGDRPPILSQYDDVKATLCCTLDQAKFKTRLRLRTQ